MINYPVILTNMNRLTTCKKMVEDLFRLNPAARITIIDNASTYPPLLDWYEKIKHDVNVIRHTGNHGPWVLLNSGYIHTIKDKWFVYSDADLELNPRMPYNWQEIMIAYSQKYDRKASLALKISDIPEHYEFKNVILDHQQVCWAPTAEKDVYLAITDMTFSMDLDNRHRYESVRLAGTMEARHIPWYIDFKNLDEEERYYLTHINRGFNEALYSSVHYDRMQKI